MFNEQDIDIRQVCANVPNWSIRSIFEPPEQEKILDRGLTDWDISYNTHKPIAQSLIQYDKLELETLIVASYRANSVQEKYLAIKELQNRGYEFNDEKGWINLEEHKRMDPETMQLVEFKG